MSDFVKEIKRRFAAHEQGKKLAAEARDRGENMLAWKHARAYDLNDFDVLDLGLPEQDRPRGFKPRIPEARGCVP